MRPLLRASRQAGAVEYEYTALARSGDPQEYVLGHMAAAAASSQPNGTHDSKIAQVVHFIRRVIADLFYKTIFGRGDDDDDDDAANDGNSNADKDGNDDGGDGDGNDGDVGGTGDQDGGGNGFDDDRFAYTDNHLGDDGASGAAHASHSHMTFLST